MRIGIVGAGAMAKEVAAAIEERKLGGAEIELAGMYEPLGDQSIGDALGVPDVIIDFSNPANIWEICDFAEEHNIGLVIATTGMKTDERARIALSGMTVPVVFSANYSLGVNVVARAVNEISKILGSDYDIEIIEKHHRRKLDAPSGTALLLAGAINEQEKYEFTYGREGSSKRKPLEVGIHAVRGGMITGDHTVIFAGEDEVIEVTHRAGSRKIFAGGALKAASFVRSAKPGVYSMEDVLWEKI